MVGKFLKSSLLEWLKMHLPDRNLTNYYTAQNRQFDDAQKTLIFRKIWEGRIHALDNERKGDLWFTTMLITRSCCIIYQGAFHVLRPEVF